MNGSTSGSGPLGRRSTGVTSPGHPVEVPHTEVPRWSERFGVVAGITERGGGPVPFDLGLAGDAPVGTVLDRWRALQAATGARSVVVSRQVHGCRVSWQQDLPAGLSVQDGSDGHASRTPGLLLAVTVADCLPVYLVDPVARAIALLHAGWRGTAGGILAAGIACLRERAGSRVPDVAMHVGPGICGACYQVGAEVPAALGVASEGVGPFHVDLRDVLVEQAGRLGVGEVSTSQLCSSELRNRFFSHRASGGRDGRMVAYLALRP